MSVALKIPEPIGKGVAVVLPGPISDEDLAEIRRRAGWADRTEDEWRNDVQTLLGQVDRLRFLAELKPQA